MRKLPFAILAVIASLVLAGNQPRQAAGVSTIIFPVSFSGVSSFADFYSVPGRKTSFKVTQKNLSAILKGELDDFAKDYLPLDPGGTVYLYYDSLTSWRIATNPNGQNTVPLTGRVANDGTFWMMGAWNFGTAGSIFVVGKVKFQKDSFDAKSISANAYFYSELIGIGLNLKAKTGKAVL